MLQNCTTGNKKLFGKQNLYGKLYKMSKFLGNVYETNNHMESDFPYWNYIALLLLFYGSKLRQYQTIRSSRCFPNVHIVSSLLIYIYYRLLSAYPRSLAWMTTSNPTNQRTISRMCFNPIVLTIISVDRHSLHLSYIWLVSRCYLFRRRNS